LKKALNMGMDYRPACAYAGVSYKQLRVWINRAEEEYKNGEETIYTAFLDDFENIIAVMEYRCLARVEAGRAGWQGAAWKLERRFPDRWRQRTGIELTGANGGPVQTESGTEALARLKAELDAAEQDPS